jgi:hypothetical protein
MIDFLKEFDSDPEKNWFRSAHITCWACFGVKGPGYRCQHLRVYGDWSLKWRYFREPSAPVAATDEAKRFRKYHHGLNHHGLEARIAHPAFSSTWSRMRLNDGRVLPAFLLESPAWREP